MFTAQDVKLLRQLTSAGMMDCKKALVAANGDMDKATDILRLAGLADAEKRQNRTTSEGVVVISDTGDRIEKTECETDFVARNADFIKYAQDSVNYNIPPEDMWSRRNAFKENVGSSLVDMSGMPGDVFGSYVHSNKKIGALVNLKGGDVDLANKIAMHIAAANPQYVSRADVPSEVEEKEYNFLMEEVAHLSKPQEIKEKMVLGRMAKFYSRVCLLNQTFVLDDSKTVAEALGDAKLVAFTRAAVGSDLSLTYDKALVQELKCNACEQAAAKARGEIVLAVMYGHTCNK
jgi:elongation factor Ts